jgi:hypothetical protein
MSNIDRHELSFVRQRIAAGDSVYIFCDYHGQTLIILYRGWLIKRRTQVKLPPDEIAQVKEMLRARRQGNDLAA